MHRILVSACLILAAAGCGTGSDATETTTAIPLSINNPTAETAGKKTDVAVEEDQRPSPKDTAQLETAAVRQLVQKAG